MTTTIKFKADELKRLLANATLFAAPAKDYLPALEVVRFDWDGDRLFTVATNRYVLSWEESWPVEADGREAFSVVTPDAKRIIAMLPEVPGPADEVTVEYDGDSAKAQFTSGHDVMIVSTYHEREFPKWRNLIPVAEAAEAVDTITLKAEWLALLAKVKADGKLPVRFQFNGAKPVSVSIGEHFKAIVIQIKNAG